MWQDTRCRPAKFRGIPKRRDVQQGSRGLVDQLRTLSPGMRTSPSISPVIHTACFAIWTCLHDEALA